MCSVEFYVTIILFSYPTLFMFCFCFFINFVSPDLFLFYRIIQPPPQSVVWFVDKWTDEPFLYDGAVQRES